MMKSSDTVEDDEDYLEIKLLDSDSMLLNQDSESSSNWNNTFSFKVNGTDCFGIESTQTKIRGYLHKCQSSTITCHIIVSCCFPSKLANEFEMDDLALLLPAIAQSLDQLSKSCRAAIMAYWYSNNQIVFDIASLTRIGIMRFVPAVIACLCNPNWSNIINYDFYTSPSSRPATFNQSVPNFESDKMSHLPNPLSQAERYTLLDRLLFTDPDISTQQDESYIDRLRYIHSCCFVPDKICVIFSGPLSMEEIKTCMMNVDAVFEDISLVVRSPVDKLLLSGVQSSIVSSSSSSFDNVNKVPIINLRHNSTSCLCVLLWPIVGPSSVSDLLIIKLIWRYLSSLSSTKLLLKDYLIFESPANFHAAVLAKPTPDGIERDLELLRQSIVASLINIDLDQVSAIVDSEYQLYSIACDNNWRNVVLTEFMAQHNDIKMGLDEDLMESENTHLQGKFCRFLETLKSVRRIERESAQLFWREKINKYFLSVTPSCILIPTPQECQQQAFDCHKDRVSKMSMFRSVGHHHHHVKAIPLSVGSLLVQISDEVQLYEPEPSNDYLPEYSIAQVRSVLCQPTIDSRRYKFSSIQNYSSDEEGDVDDEADSDQTINSSLASEFFRRFRLNIDKSDVTNLTRLPFSTQITQANNCKLMQVTVWLDTSSLSAYLRLFLELFLEVIFHVGSNNNSSSSSSLYSRISKCFVIYDARLGTSHCNFNCGSWSQLISLNFSFQRNNLSLALDLIREILFDGDFSGINMEGFVCRLIQEASWKDHDPYAIAYSAASCLMLDKSTSNAAITSVVPQISVLRYVMQELQSNPTLMADRLNSIRKSISKPHDMYFHLSGNVLRPIHTSDGPQDPLGIIMQKLSGYFVDLEYRPMNRIRKQNPFDMSIPLALRPSTSRIDKIFNPPWSKSLRKFTPIGKNRVRMRIVDVDSSNPMEFVQSDSPIIHPTAAGSGELSGKIFGICESENSASNETFNSCISFHLPLDISYYDESLASLHVTLEYLSHVDSGFCQSLSDEMDYVDVQVDIELGLLTLTVFGKDINPSKVHRGGLNWINGIGDRLISNEILNAVRNNTILLFLERENTCTDAAYQCMMNTIMGVNGDYNSHMANKISTIRPSDIVSCIHRFIEPLLRLRESFAVWVDRKCRLKRNLANFIEPANLQILTFDAIVNELSPFDFKVYSDTEVVQEEETSLSPFVVGVASLFIGGLAVAAMMAKKWK